MSYRVFWVALFFSVIVFAQQDDESGESPLDREKWFMRHRLDRSGQVSASGRIRALAARDRLLAAGNAAYPSQNWQLIGPQPETSLGGSSGRVTALAVDPRSAQVAYAGGAEGGLWKTIDGGAHWLPITDNQVSLATGSIALDPQKPDTVYVGTGEANFNEDSYFGSGILKSADGGSTWVNYPGPFVGAAIGALAVSPTDSNVLLAGAFGGVYRSTDGGASWNSVLEGYNGCAIAFVPGTSGVVWAGVAWPFFDDATTGLYRSGDGGQTWAKVVAEAIPAAGIGRIAIAVAPSNGQIVYVGMSGINPTDSTKTLGLFATQDGGNTWTANTGSTYGGDWYRNTLAVSPVDPKVIFGGGLTLQRSLDGNATWGTTGYGALHVDQHAVAFSTDGTLLYAGNDGGVYVSSNAATDATVWTNMNTTLALTQFYPGFSINPADPTFAIGGTQDNGTLVYSGVPQWTYATCGDGGATIVDPFNPQTVYATCQQNGIQKSLTGGSPGSFGLVMAGIPKTEVQFVGVVAADPSAEGTIYFGGSTALWRSADGAASWTNLTSGITPIISAVSAVSVMSLDGAGVVFSDEDADTGSVDVYCTANVKAAPVTWQLCENGLEGAQIEAFVEDPRKPSAAYAVATGYGTGHVFYTSNGGTSWTDLTGDLPDVPVSALVIDPDTAYLYIGTDVGVFLSGDNGAHWQPLGNGLPNTVVTGLALYRSSRLLRASTHGRSMWDITVPIPAPTITAAGFVNSATFGITGSKGLAPGSIATLFGVQMAEGTASAVSTPLPNSLGGTLLSFGSAVAPMFYVSPNQLNLQVPWETPVGTVNASLTVGQQTSTSTVNVVPYAPGIYTLNASGSGQGVVTNLDYTWAAPAGSIPGVTARPASPGGYIVIYCTGLGPVTNPPPTGVGGPGRPATSTTATPVVMIGGVAGTVQFSGLTPGAVGLYQINVQLPANVSTGNSVPVSVSIGGATSDTVTIAVAAP